MTWKYLTWHWSAGGYRDASAKYHLCIGWDGSKAYLTQSHKLDSPAAHTWHRNTGNIGCAVLAGLTPEEAAKLGCDPTPVLEEQWELQARVSAEAVLEFIIPADQLQALVAPGLTLDAAQAFADKWVEDSCFDHEHWATLDGYGPGSGSPDTRVDVGTERSAWLRTKTAWHLARLITGEFTREHTFVS